MSSREIELLFDIGSPGQQATRDRLRAITGDAIDPGAFGAPTMFVDDIMYWGNDRLDLFEAALTEDD